MIPTPTPTIRPWAPLSDPEWAALAPLLPRSTHPALRHRLNCFLAVAAHGSPWIPAGAPGPFWPTVYRHFHRWARAGAWARLHRAAGAADAPATLRGLADWLAALHRRAARIAPINPFIPKNPKPGFPATPRPTAPIRLFLPTPESNPFEPTSTRLSPLNPRVPRAFRPLAGGLGGSAPQPCHAPIPAAVCRNGAGERAA